MQLQRPHLAPWKKLINILETYLELDHGTGIKEPKQKQHCKHFHAGFNTLLHIMTNLATWYIVFRHKMNS